MFTDAYRTKDSKLRVGIENVFQAVFRLVYIPEDKNFMLELYDFSIDCLDDKLSEDFSFQDIFSKKHHRIR